MSSGMKERLCRSLEKVLHAETRELPAAEKKKKKA